MCETVREKWLNKIPIILLLFSNSQATWSDGKQDGKQGEERGIDSQCLLLVVLVDEIKRFLKFKFKFLKVIVFANND